jgi:Ser/Thr protein kinase RdoA (MazF antagonist)
MSPVSLDVLLPIAQQFATRFHCPPELAPEEACLVPELIDPSLIVAIEPFGQGNINGTFRVTVADRTPHFILQRINGHVFQQPELIMANMRQLCDHVQARLATTPLNRPWVVVQVLTTVAGADYWRDGEGGFWRAISYIEGADAFDQIQDANHGSEIGRGLGIFHQLISDLPTDRLADTLVGFHIAPQYLAAYDRVLAKPPIDPRIDPRIGQRREEDRVQTWMKFVADRRDWLPVLEQAKAAGKLSLRPIHGDPKINNIMIDSQTHKAISLIDLDTVKPGLIHYDIGDCLRSSCNLLGEETLEFDRVCFDLDLCRAVLQGYLAEARSFLQPADYDYLFDGIRLIALELGLRFFTDYLAGDTYFTTRYPDHNLNRAIVQFKLTESIEAQETAIRAIIDELR